jgi:hypothetical protein
MTPDHDSNPDIQVGIANFTGVATVIAPVVALGILLVATPGVIDSWELGTMTTMGAVLLAVAVREIWARRFRRTEC